MVWLRIFLFLWWYESDTHSVETVPKILFFFCTRGASLMVQWVRIPPAMQETWVQSLGWEDPLEEEMATDSSILAWEIPWTKLWATVHGVPRVRHDWANKPPPHEVILSWDALQGQPPLADNHVITPTHKHSVPRQLLFFTFRPVCHKLHKKVHAMCALCAMCPTLYDPMDCCPPGSSVHGIFQARILEWVAIPFFRGSSQPRDQNCIPSITRQNLYHPATWEAYFLSIYI